MSAVEWVERRIGRTLNPDQARCVQVLCSFAQPYNLQLIGDGWASATSEEPWDEYDGDFDDIPLVQPVILKEKYLVVNLLGSLATFDFPELTRLVLAGHEHAVRVEITPRLYRWVNDDSPFECSCTEVDESVLPEDRDHEAMCQYGDYPNGTAACLEVSFHARARERSSEGGIWEWHPTIEQVLTRG